MTPEGISNNTVNWENNYSGTLPIKNATELGSQLSDELRTTLTSIRGSLSLLHSGKFEQKSEKGQRMLEIAIKNTERLVNLTAAIEQEHDQFFYLCTDLLCVGGFDGYFKRLNPSWEKKLGFTKAELLAKPYIEFVHPEDRSATLSAARKLCYGRESVSLENRYLCKDGSYKWLFWNVVPYNEEQLIYAIGRDITERKEAEAQLQRTQAFLNSVISHLPVGVFIKGAANVNFGDPLPFVMFNKAIEEITGLTKEETIGKTDYDFFPQEQANFFIAKDWEVLSCRQLLDIPEEPIQTRHQGLRTLHTRKIPVKDDEGNPQYLLGICEDITERKQTEEALRQSEERFRSLVSNIPGAIFRCSFDRDLTMDFISEAIADISGYPASDFIQKQVRSFNSIVHPEDIIRLERIIRQAVARHIPYIVEYRIIRADNSIRWVYEKGQAIFDENGEVICLDGAIFDITERKQAEWRLGVQHATNRVLADASSIEEAIPQILQAIGESLGWKVGEFWRFDQQSNVLRCSQMWYEQSLIIPEFNARSNQTTFAPGSGLPGRILSLGAPMWIADVVQDENFLNSEIAQRTGLHAAFGFPALSGSEILGVFTFFSQDIQPTDEDLLQMMTAIGSQIGQFMERQEAKEALQHSESLLRKQATELQQTLQELKQTQARLVQSEKMSALGRLVAGVAHEINNPVSFIHCNLEHTNQYAQSLVDLLRLYAKYYPHPAAEITEQAEEIDLDFIVEDLPKILSSMQTGTNRIREIVLSLRNFSRLDEAQRKWVNIHEGLDSALLILQNRIAVTSCRPAIAIVKEYSNIPLVKCFPSPLNQVFMNLLNNAIDAIEDKAWEMNNSLTPTPTISIRTEILDLGSLSIIIADNGCGIKEEIKRQIFDPFFTTKPVGKGTGLGLSISYQIIVEKHGGILECTSQPDQGAEFCIQIPLQQ